MVATTSEELTVNVSGLPGESRLETTTARRRRADAGLVARQRRAQTERRLIGEAAQFGARLKRRRRPQ